MNKPNIEQIINHYNLSSHPEGGYYKETYRSEQDFSTAIYFLLPKGTQSSLHRIKSDEVWHFYLGGPMTLYQISPDGKLERVTLGQKFLEGEKLQHVVPAGYWFGGHPNSKTEFSFVGCTVAPGFKFNDFELGTKEELLKLYPNHSELIQRLT